MLHTRPGFAPRKDDTVCAKLNADMIPAINRNKRPDSTPLAHNLQARADDANARLKKAQDALNLAQAQAAAAKAGPDLLINPTPSDPPVVNDIVNFT